MEKEFTLILIDSYEWFRLFKVKGESLPNGVVIDFEEGQTKFFVNTHESEVFGDVECHFYTEVDANFAMGEAVGRSN